MAPRGHALGLVHHQQSRTRLCQPLHHLVLGQLLRRQVQQTGLAPAHRLPSGLRPRRAEVGVDGDGTRGAVTVRQPGDLVPLQGQQRRHHHDRSGQHQGRDLVDGGLAGAGWHDDEGVLAPQHPLHGRELLG